MSNLILVWDTETTGIPDWKIPSEDPAQPHIVQIGAFLVDTDTRAIVDGIDVIVRPDGWVIPQETIEKHGITNEIADDLGVPEAEALRTFLDMWNGYQRVAFNTTFDNRIIRIATKRFCDEETIDRWHQGKQGEEWVCMMMAARKHLGGKNPTLTDAYKAITGKDLQNAHNALADAEACMEIYFALNPITEAA